MYHTIEFGTMLTVDVEISFKQPLERVSIKEGTRVRTMLRPYVVENDNGLIEVADLFFEDGTTTRGVPFENFKFVD